MPLPATPGWVSLPLVVGGPATPSWGPLAALLCGVWCVAVVCWWGCGWCVMWLVPRHSWRRFLCATPRHSWLGLAPGGGGRSPPLLAGVRWRWCCVVCGVWRWCVGGVVAGAWCGWSLATPGGGPCVLLPATPGWVSLPLVVGGPRHSWLGSVGGGGVWCVVCGVWWWCVVGVVVGVWRVAVVCCWGCGWCAVWLVPRHSWLWSLCATPRHSWPGFAAGGGGWSPPLLAGVRWRRWCVVCGVWCVGGVPRHSWRWFLCATPRHSWLGSAGGGGVWCVVCGVWRWCVVGVVVAVWCGWSLATPGGGPCVLLPATPSWVSLPVVVGGPRHSWLGSVGSGGLWCVVCWWGPSPLLAEVPVCYSPPLLAGFRCRWWWAVPATPGWGPLAAVACGVCSCACSLGRVGRAGLPGAFWCASPFPLAALSSCFAWPPPGRGCPSLFRCCCRSSLVVFLRALPPRLCLLLGRWPLFGGCSPAPLPFCVSRFSSLLPWCFCCFFFPPSSSSSVRPRCLWFSLVSGPGCPGPRRLRCLLCLPSVSGLSVRLSLFRAFRLVVGCSRVVAAPPPLCFAVFSSCRSVLCAVWCCASLGAVLRRAAARCVARCSAVVCCVALVWCRCLLRRALWRCPSPWGPVLCGAVFCGVPPRCVLCAVCVLSWRGGACCCSPLCLVLCVSRGAVPCVPCALRSVRCCAPLCWWARVVLFVWCVVLLAPGALVRCCVLCCFLWCAVVRCWVWWPVVVCWWRVSVSVSLSGRVDSFPVVGVVCCGALLSCVVFCGAVLSRGAVLLCSGVVLRCCWGLVCPPVGCRAVLCCAVGWLCCLWPGGGVCVLWCSFPRAVRSLSSPLCALRCLVVLAVVPCFPVSCAVALCCRVVLCCRFAVLFVLVLPSCGLSCGASVVCAVVGASCCGVSLCVVVSPWAFCGVVVLLWCVVVSCCAVRCPVVSCALCRVLRCRAALRCCAVCFSFCPVFLC